MFDLLTRILYLRVRDSFEKLYCFLSPSVLRQLQTLTEKRHLLKHVVRVFNLKSLQII